MPDRNPTGSYRVQAGQNGDLSIQQYKFVTSLRILNAMDKNVSPYKPRRVFHSAMRKSPDSYYIPSHT
jgi:hypothetical protein